MIYFMKFFLLLTLVSNLYAQKDLIPTFFIGVKNNSNDTMLQDSLLSSSDDLTKWNLTKYTSSLLKTKFGHKLKGNNFNLMIRDDFEKNATEIIRKSQSKNDRIGFFMVETHQDIEKNTSKDYDSIRVTMSITFAQIGAEQNRKERFGMEIRYSNSIVNLDMLGLKTTDSNQKEQIQRFYQEMYQEAIGELLELIILDTNPKRISHNDDKEIFFSVDKIRTGKHSNKFAQEVFGNKNKFKEYIILLFKENLIRNIRKDETLNSIVLLGSELTNDKIRIAWDNYLVLKLQEMGGSGSSNKTNEISERRIVASCIDKDPLINSLDGYQIELLYNKLYNKVVHEAPQETLLALYSTLHARVIIALKKKKKIDGLSTPSNIIKKKKTVLSQNSTKYTVEVDKSRGQEQKANILYVHNIIDKTIKGLTPKVIDMMKDIVKKRRTFLKFNKFCK